jgi:hypothetical protein
MASDEITTERKAIESTIIVTPSVTIVPGGNWCGSVLCCVNAFLNVINNEPCYLWYKYRKVV